MQTACHAWIATPEPRGESGRMIQAINTYLVQRFERIKKPQTDPLAEAQPIKVYPPEADRSKGLTERPSIAITLLNDPPDTKLARPGHEIFIPSEETVTVQAPEQFGAGLKASIVGSEREPYQIEQGVNDILAFRIGKEGAWGPDQAVTFMPGSREAWEIARSCNIFAKGVKAAAVAGKLKLETIRGGDDIEILDNIYSAHGVLGLPLGVTSHLTRTGPASWTVKPYPTPIELYYQVDLRTVEEAQARTLVRFVADCLPHKHRPLINGQYPLFLAEKPQNLDELAKPEFWTAFRYEVHFVWLDRFAGYQVKPIQDFRTDLGA